MARVTGSDKKSSDDNKSKLSDTLKKVTQFTPAGVVKKAIETGVSKIKNKKEDSKVKKELKKKVEKAETDNKRFPPKDKFPKGMIPAPDVKTMPDDGKRPDYKTMPDVPGKRPKYKLLNKGGRVNFRMGGKCKLSKRGKGRAYGKNS